MEHGERATRIRKRAQDRWRHRTHLRKVEAWLPPDVVELLDQFVAAGGYRSRAAALSALFTRRSDKGLHVVCRKPDE